MPDPLATRTADLGTVSAGDAPPPGPAATPTPAERYALGEEIARGGMGVVYRATDTAFDREVAVKVLHDKYAPSSGTARRFHDEARITGQLQHPGIPPAHDLGTLPDGRPFLAMKLIKGDTLGELLAVGPDHGRFVAVFEKVCEAVAYAHARVVVHRDLKPQNVMVGNFGEVQVMDWGLAKVLGERPRVSGPSLDPDETAAAGTEVKSLRDSDDLLTQAGSVLGTPAYMPPEQAVGAVHEIDRRSDVFGLGGILAAILTGRPPFVADTAETTRVMAARGEVGDCFARLDACGADPELVALAKRCLAPKRDARPADAGEVAKAVATLRAAADERARQAELDKVRVEGEKAAAEVQSAEQRKRRRVQAALGMTFTALVVLAGLALWWNDRTASERRREREVAETRVASEVRGLLDQAKQALGREEIGPADLALGQAEARLGGAGPDDLRAELDRLRTDREMLIRLRDIDDLRWMDPGGDFTPPENPSGPQFAAAIRWYGITLSPDARPATVERITGSAIREQLVAALDAWLAVGADDPTGLAALLDALDPDDLRREYRTATANRDFVKLRELIRRPDVTRLPPRFLTTVLPLRNRQLPWAEVRTALEAAWTANPGEFRFAFQVGYLRREQMAGQPHVTIGYLRAAVAARPTHVPALALLGISLGMNNQIAEAIQILERAVALDRSYSEAGYNLALAYHYVGNRSKADETLEATAGRDPKPARVEFRRGAMHELRKENEQAIARFRRATELDPNWPEPHLRLAFRLEQRGDLDEAFREFSRVIELQQSWTYGYVAVGGVLESKGQFSSAIDTYRGGLKIDPTDANISVALVNLLFRTKDLDGAETVCRAALKHDAGTARWHSNLGITLERKGDFDGAIAAFAEARKLDRNFSPVPTQRLVRMKDLLTRLPDVLAGKADPRTPAEFFDFARLCVAPQKRYADAVRLYEKGFAANQTPAGDTSINPNRYNAACAAARAARGDGIDAPTDPAVRAALRAKALGWLKADLAVHRRSIAAGPGNATPSQVSYWLADPDLSGLRPGLTRIGMPAAERAEWDSLWADLRSALAEARKPPPK